MTDRIRAASAQHITVNGYQSLWAIGEFGGGKDPGTELLVFVGGEHGSGVFSISEAKRRRWKLVQPFPLRSRTPGPPEPPGPDCCAWLRSRGFESCDASPPARLRQFDDDEAV